MRAPARVIAPPATALIIAAAVVVGATGALGGSDDPSGAGTVSDAAGNVNVDDTTAATAPLTDAVPPPAGIPQSVEEMTPALTAFPLARLRPTKEQADLLAGAPIDLVHMRTVADELKTTFEVDLTVGEAAGDPYVDYVWGDVENYQAGQRIFDADDIVVRMIRRVGTGEQREFHIVSFSAKTGLTTQERASTTHGGVRPNHFTYDLPETVWAD
jgi:hypothetical protein